MNNSFVLAGNLLYTPTKERFAILENGYLVVENGVITGAFERLPEPYRGLPLTRYERELIVPGLCDTHVHAPQYAFRGLGMDLTLLDWLSANVFPEEARYENLSYAQTAYGQFVQGLGESATTRVCVFATLHAPAALLLTELLEKAGLRGFVGKVNMDRNAPGLEEPSAAESLRQTRRWLDEAQRHTAMRPILTPRFIPSCSDELLSGLAALKAEQKLPLQSHLSENMGEIAWVRELCPDASCYADAYARRGLLSGNVVMAHCVHPEGPEEELLKRFDVLVAHCPASNMNLSSGVAPVRRYLEHGLRVGLGTDVAGGFSLSVFRAMADAIQVSKLRSVFDPDKPKPLGVSEAFYLGTKGGGTLFGKVGSFEKGYEADIVVLDDSALLSPQPLTVAQRIERAVYLENQVRVAAKYVAGENVTYQRRKLV